MTPLENASQVARFAAESGQVADVDGAVINRGGTRLAVVRGATKPTVAEAPPPPPAPVPAPAPDTSALQAVLGAVRDQGDAIAQALAAVLDRVQPPAPRARMRPISFAVVRNAAGEAISLVPAYGEGAATVPQGFDHIRGDDGLSHTIIPNY